LNKPSDAAREFAITQKLQALKRTRIESVMDAAGRRANPARQPGLVN
jgi:hypothetical protein